MALETVFQALADSTRLRVMRLLGSMELAVGELAQVLGQSQPRVSRHVGILTAAGLAERRREGSWVFLRAAHSDKGEGLGSALAQALALAEDEDAEFARICEQDRQRLAAIRAAREQQAEGYFSEHAQDWDALRRLHTPDEEVEQALAEQLARHPLGRVLDIGTGTGRIAELFAEKAEHVVALDKSLAMLRVARAKLQHLPTERVELVQGDFEDLPFEAESFDTVVFHQVLHFAQDPAVALAEAARVLRGGGRVAIVDFAAHGREDLRVKHAHTRLGFDEGQMNKLLADAGFSPSAPTALAGGELVVNIWISGRQAADADNGKVAR